MTSPAIADASIESADVPRKGTIDLNSILRLLNIAILAATIVAYASTGANEYLNGESIVLAGILALQTHVALMIEARRRDPFVVVIAFILILYFSLRILTLLFFPVSAVFWRFPYAASDSNYALIFMILANCFLFAGLYAVRGGPLEINLGTWHPTAPVRATLWVGFVVGMIYSRGILWNPDSLPRLIQVLFVFVAQSVVVLMAITYLVLFHRQMRWSIRVLFAALLVGEMVLHTLAGSRSAFVYATQNLMLAVLAVHGAARLPRRLVAIIVATLPATAIVLVAGFIISTTVASLRASGEQFSFSRALSTSTQLSGTVDRDYALNFGVPLLFARTGFFDFSAEIIAHRQKYEPIVNLPAYGKSIIDNLLTPGFDVFDQPKIANALAFVYSERGRPSKVESVEAYQSDQLGIYGDFFVVFGWASLPLFFLVGFFARRIYFAVRDENPYLMTMKRVAVLSIFVIVFNSFGLDWVVAEIVPLVVAIHVYQFFFAARPVSVGVAAASSA